jgi:hypothetical protein
LAQRQTRFRKAGEFVGIARSGGIRTKSYEQFPLEGIARREAVLVIADQVAMDDREIISEKDLLKAECLPVLDPAPRTQAKIHVLAIGMCPIRFDSGAGSCTIPWSQHVVVGRGLLRGREGKDDGWKNLALVCPQLNVVVPCEKGMQELVFETA